MWLPIGNFISFFLNWCCILSLVKVISVQAIMPPINNLFFWFYTTMIFSRIDPNIGIIVLSPNMQTMIQSVIWTLEAEEELELLVWTPSTNLSGIGTIHHSLLRLKERPISGIISENIVRFRPWHIKALNHTSITITSIDTIEKVQSCKMFSYSNSTKYKYNI